MLFAGVLAQGSDNMTDVVRDASLFVDVDASNTTALVGVEANSSDGVGTECLPPPKGSITICKIIIDQENKVVNGSLLPSSKFTIDGIIPNQTSEAKPAGKLNQTIFTTPIQFNADFLGSDKIKDAFCVQYPNLDMGSYYYGEESIVPSGGIWSKPKYNDQYTVPVKNLSTFYDYDPNLFDGNPSNDSLRNKNSDAHIILTTDRKNRTLVILNQYFFEACNNTYCNSKDGWYDTGEMRRVNCTENVCMECEEKQQDYRDYGCGTGGTCDLRTIGYWKQPCLGHYNHETEASMTGYLILIHNKTHFFDTVSSFSEMCSILDPSEPATMFQRAQQQIMALWLNVVSGKVFPGTSVNVMPYSGAATVASALSEAESISAVNESESERAKSIADTINNDGPAIVSCNSGEASCQYNVTGSKWIATGNNYTIPCEFCGDEKVQAPEEECDDGANGDDTDGCTDSCKFTYCGDDIIQHPNGYGFYEVCDDNGNNGIPCVPPYGGSCAYCTGTCEGETLYGPYCGDGTRQAPYEECDGTDGVPEHYECLKNCTLKYIPYCGDGILDAGEECDDGNKVNGDGCSSQCNIEPMIIIADKIVCDKEGDLPNWGKGGPDITSSTRGTFLSTRPGCRAEDGWKFQWAYSQITNPGDHVGEAAGGWHTFGPTAGGRANTSIYNLSGTPKIWLREVFKDGYINFTYNQNGNNENNVSAEIYCHKDVINYDNYDYIISPALGKTYYCIAFNALAGCKDNETPDTIKTYGNPFYTDGISEWINSSTKITLNTTDGNTCPSNTTTYYRVSLVEDKYCRNQTACQALDGQGAWIRYLSPFTINDESCHLIQFYANDTAGNAENKKQQCAFVDNKAPAVNKTIGSPRVISGDKTYITQQTPITLNCTDPSPHPVNHVNLSYRYRFSNDCNAWGVWSQLAIAGAEKIIYFGEDSCHELEYSCTDLLGNKGKVISEIDIVDTKPPVINTTIIGPKYYNATEGRMYIDGVTNISVNSTDQQPHPVGNVTCNWDYTVDGGIKTGQGESGLSPPFLVHFPEESKHILTINCTDALGNKASVTQIYYVDKTSPTIGKSYGQPYYTNGTTEWISNSTKITLSVTDAGPHKSGINETKYRVTLLGSNSYCQSQSACQPATGNGSWTPYTAPFTIGEDSCHLIEYFSVDNVNKSSLGRQCVFVDNKKPTVSADTYSPKIKCSDSEGCDYWIQDHVTEIKLSCYDNSPHPSGKKSIEYRWKLDGEWPENNPSGAWLPYTAPIIFEEDSVHDLEYRCTDNVGNLKVGPGKKYRVDSTPPVINKTINGPRSGDCPPDSPDDICFIDGVTSIAVSAYDPDPTGHGCNVGNVTCDWGYYLDGSEWHGWNSTFPIKFPEETRHDLVVRCRDALGNIAWDNETFYVDKTAPVTTKTYSGFLFGGENGGPEWISLGTEIILSVEDKGPHKSGIDYTAYRISLVDEGYCASQAACMSAQGTGNWTKYSLPFHVGEESCHLIEYYSVDNVNKTESINKQCAYVDDSPPVINKTIVGPWVGNCPPRNETDVCYIGNASEIRVNVTDSGPHPSGITSCNWTYIWNNTNYFGGAFLSGTTIKFLEDSRHELIITCTDAAGHMITDNETFLVDLIPPTTTKTYGEPFVEGYYPEGCNTHGGISSANLPVCANGENDCQPGCSIAHWINSSTLVNMSANDTKSGVNRTYWRNLLVDDDEAGKMICGHPESFCRPELYYPYVSDAPMNEYTKPFNKTEESCHVIEFYSVDNVGNAEPLKWQCVFVDNTSPVPNKRVGEPKTLWDGKDSTYYPWIKDKCWNGRNDSIDCWKVTLFTPITLGCADPEPHPVRNETLCYKVDFDGEDITEKYCEERINGDGWCCGKPTGTTFRFNEESEHNLKYYCVDALGNAGPVDDEKFKVEGTSFRINLNKKWNLISVPLVMQNDSIYDVFKDVAITVESVWTYDPEHEICDDTSGWCVYTPGPAPDTLSELIPGWGYWVKSYNDSVLTIGGSLFSPAKTPPDKSVVKGWNLIGYYGTDGLTSYNGPVGAGKNAQCALHSLVNTMLGHPRWSSLVTYWEQYNPNLWIYLNQYNRMDPGAGYWLEMDESDIYSYSTECST